MLPPYQSHQSKQLAREFPVITAKAPTKAKGPKVTPAKKTKKAK